MTAAPLFDLSGKTALLTGDSRGHGLQIAEARGGAGARLVVPSRKAADFETAKAQAAHLARQSAGVEPGGSR